MGESLNSDLIQTRTRTGQLFDKPENSNS